jgi:peroxiredoxin
MATANPSRSWIKPAIACGVLLALVAGAYVALTHEPAAPQMTFISLKGEKVSSESLRGKVVIVNFWATDCKTCIKEMPQMVETYNKYKGKGLEFVAVAMKYDPPNYVVNFAETRQLPFIVTLDSVGEIAKSFGDVALTPTTFVIDKNGKIIKRYVGEPEFPALHALIEKALAG